MPSETPRPLGGDDERLTYSIAEAANLLGISRSTAYECVQTGDLPALHFGRRIVISRRTIEQMLGLQPTDASATES